MKKSLLFLGVMLTCAMPLFTSCVDGDMYEIYDEDGLFISRSKKSKDLSNNNGSNTGYPPGFLYENKFYPGECAACCYDNYYHVGYAVARMVIIKQLYGDLSDEHVAEYYNSVKTRNNSPSKGETILAALKGNDENWEMPPMTDAFKYIVNNNYSSDRPLALLVDGHVGQVIKIDPVENNRKIFVNFYIKDQFPDNSTQYQRCWTVTINKKKKTVDYSDIRGFIWHK